MRKGLTHITIDVGQSGKYPLMPDGKSQGQLKVYMKCGSSDPVPYTKDIKWRFPDGGHPLGCNLTDDGVLTAGTEVGEVTVEAYSTACNQEDNRITPKTAVVKIACESCQGGCKLRKSGEVKLGSVHMTFSLGMYGRTGSAGEIYVKADTMSSELYKPRSLQLSTVRPGVDIIRGSGAVRQVMNPDQNLVNIVIVSDSEYCIRYYKPSQVEGKINGLYKLYDDQTPYEEYVISNPNQPPDYSQLHVVRKVDGVAVECYDYIYTLDNGNPYWQFITKDGSCAITARIERMRIMASGDNTRIERRTVSDGRNGGAVYDVEKVYTKMTSKPSIEKVTEERVWGEYIGDWNRECLTTSSTYFDMSGDRCGLLKTVKNPDGTWAMYDYDTQGRMVAELRPWGDMSMPEILASGTGRYTSYAYDAVDSRDTGALYPAKPRTITEYGPGNVILSRTYNAYFVRNEDGKIIEISEQDSSGVGYGATDNLRTTTTYYAATAPGASAGRIESVEYPDGRQDSYVYALGTCNTSTYEFTSGSGADLKTVIKHGTTAMPDGLANQSTWQVTVVDKVGETLYEETQVYDGQASISLGKTRYAYDQDGRSKTVYYPNGTQENSISGCCHALETTDINGIRTTYDEYDTLGNVLQQTRDGIDSSGQPGEPGYRQSILTVNTYDAMGRRLTSTVGNTLLTKTDYDYAGRVKKTTDASNVETGYDYSPGSQTSGKWTTITRPGQVGERTEYYQDGRVKQVIRASSPNEVVLRYYEYGIENGKQYTKVYTGGLGAAMYTMTLVDALGRTVEERRAGFPANGNATTVVTSYDYCPDNTVPNSKGKVKQTTMTAGSTVMITLYEYNALGEQTATGQNLDGTAGLTRTPPGGTTPADRISETETAYEQAQNIWWQVTRSKVYRDGQSTPTTVSTQKRQVTGLGGGITERTITQDVRGNQTTTTITVDRTAKKVTTETAYPDTNERDISEVINGLAHRNVSKNGAVAQYGYDSLGRTYKVYDSRKGTTTTDYYGNGDGQKGKVYTVKDHENRTTTYTYISTTGQVFSVQNPLGKLQFYAYNDRGQMEKTWGDTTYPVKNVYDAMGRRVEMHTYQSGTAWNASTWPSPEPDSNTTTWEFDVASGLLKKKTDDSNEYVEYTYTPDGRQKMRTWARKINNTDDLITTYAYNDVTGEMTGITYSDGTPSVTYEYNRLGRQSKVIQTKAAPNGWTHTTTFNLNQYLELESEAITGDIYAKTITRNHQGSGTGLLPGRDAGFSIGNEYSVEYDYDEYGRLNYISGDSLGLPGGAVIYEYVPNSNLVNAVNYLDAGANDLAWTIRAYGTSTDHRDLLTSVENHNGSTVMSKYAYQHDNAGRRTAVLTTGDAFDNGAFNIWGYNDRSELQASNRYNGNQIVIPPDPQTEVTGERRLYHYDPIGNRVEYTFGTGSPLYYCPNGLNQYDSTGVQQSCPQGNPSESFSYDHDGNMTADGTLTYEWDGENRLTAVYPTNPASTSKKCTFTYDFMSRRIRKQVYTRNDNNTAWNTTPSEDWRFVYDQWNVVLVLDGRDGPDEGTAPDNVTVRKYTWGLDLSGLTGIASPAGIHGAGGIGGLLAAVETGGEDDYAYWYLYDGNGNVGQVLDATDTENITTAALYEYDPYGNLIVADGYYALNNPFRFSTKWFDVETELYYYGYRYYSPRLGRWINRDPIGERGGFNLYEFIWNRPMDQIDLWGMQASQPTSQPSLCQWPPFPAPPPGNVPKIILPNDINMWGPYLHWLIAKEDEDIYVDPTQGFGLIVRGMNTTLSLETQMNQNIRNKLQGYCRCKPFIGSGFQTISFGIDAQKEGTYLNDGLVDFINIGNLHMKATVVCNIRNCCDHCKASCIVTYDTFDYFHWDINPVRFPPGLNDFEWHVMYTKTRSELLRCVPTTQPVEAQ